MKIEKTFTLSSYEAQEYGIGHTINGEKPKNPGFAETYNPLCSMVNIFKDFPTGTKIKVTMETQE